MSVIKLGQEHDSIDDNNNNNYIKIATLTDGKNIPRAVCEPFHLRVK